MSRVTAGNAAGPMPRSSARPAVEHLARDVLSFAQRFPPDDKSAKGALSRNGVVGGVAC